jgi:CheY-like chemotaxis protein
MTAQSVVPVLVVEDDPDIRDSIRAVLEEVGYAVFAAATAGEALDYLHGTVPAHVVLLDYVLPDGGVGLLHAAKRDPGLKRHCYVLVTAAQLDQFSDEEQRLIADVCLEVVDKPFDMDNLLKALAAAATQVR